MIVRAGQSVNEVASIIETLDDSEAAAVIQMLADTAMLKETLSHTPQDYLQQMRSQPSAVVIGTDGVELDTCECESVD